METLLNNFKKLTIPISNGNPKNNNSKTLLKYNHTTQIKIIRLIKLIN